MRREIQPYVSQSVPNVQYCPLFIIFIIFIIIFIFIIVIIMIVYHYYYYGVLFPEINYTLLNRNFDYFTS